MVSNLSTTPAQAAEKEYRQALYKAATRAVNVVETALAPGKTTYNLFEPEQLKIALSLVAIVQGVPPSEHESK